MLVRCSSIPEIPKPPGRVTSRYISKLNFERHKSRIWCGGEIGLGDLRSNTEIIKRYRRYTRGDPHDILRLRAPQRLSPEEKYISRCTFECRDFCWYIHLILMESLNGYRLRRNIQFAKRRSGRNAPTNRNEVCIHLATSTRIAADGNVHRSNPRYLYGKPRIFIIKFNN